MCWTAAIQMPPLPVDDQLLVERTFTAGVLIIMTAGAMIDIQGKPPLLH
jgi:hypothetical protein